MPDPGSIVRVAAVGDIHCGKNSRGLVRPLFENCRQVCRRAGALRRPDGLRPARGGTLLVEELSVASKLPIVAVLGNHDFESGREDEVRRILVDAGIILLDGDAVEVRGIGFAGARGFAGGFGRGTLGSWGEKAVKAFVQEAVDEAMKLESALARLRTESRVAVLHYAPIRATVENEPVEIFPFLGCGRLEEPLNRYPVTAVVHGHAHNGSPKGQPRPVCRFTTSRFP